MKKDSRGRRGSSKALASAMDKGRVVEQIVAAMHELNGVRVDRNVFLKGAGLRKREVDVLVSGSLGGYAVRVAIECKNERRPIGVQKMDAFVGKLMDIGIPSQHGVFVSTSGYTSGALARAESVGVRPLVLTGLDECRIASSVAKAFQSVVYLMADVVSMTVTNNLPAGHEPVEMLVFYDREGRLVGSLPDIVRERWIRGEIAEDLGEHEVKLNEAADWHTLADGKMEPVLSAWARVRVLGLVITIHGRQSSTCW